MNTLEEITERKDRKILKLKEFKKENKCRTRHFSG